MSPLPCAALLLPSAATGLAAAASLPLEGDDATRIISKPDFTAGGSVCRPGQRAHAGCRRNSNGATPFRPHHMVRQNRNR